MATPLKWTSKQMEYVRANCNHMSTRQLAAELHVSYSSIQRLLVKLKIPNRNESRRIEYNWTPEQKGEFMRLYPTNENEVIAKRFGICIDSVSRVARRMGIDKDEDYLRKVKADQQLKATIAANEKRTPDEQQRINAAISKTCKEMYRKDRIRYYWDLPTKYRDKYGHNPKESAARNLLRKHGYECPAGSKTQYRIIGVTNIRPKLESSYAERFGFRFKNIITQ